MEELIREILSHDIHEAEKKFPSELERLGWELFNIKPCGCGNKLIEIFILLHKKGLIMAQAKKDNQRIARLKPGVVLRVPQLGITWTNQSLDFTDEKAIEVLKKYGALESRFDVLPISPKEEAQEPVKVEKTAEQIEEEEIAAEIAKEEAEKKKKPIAPKGRKKAN